MVSRQYLWQQRQVASGRCILCGHKRRHYSHCCDRCYKKHKSPEAKKRKAARKRRLARKLAASKG